MGMWLVVVAVLAQQPETVTLRNGMTWLLVPRADEQRVSGVVVVKAGGVDESPGDTGVAHLLEHLAFSGNPLVGSTFGWSAEHAAQEDAFDAMDALSKAERARPRDEREIGRLTGALLPLENAWRSKGDNDAYTTMLASRDVRINAWTSMDDTTYWGDFPSELMQFWLVAEAQRFAAPVFRELRLEREIVLHEMVERSSPPVTAIEALIRLAWGKQGYGWLPGGARNDVATMSPRTIETFYARHYTPSNAVGVLVGGFDSAQVKTWLEQTFGSILPRAADPRVTVTANQPGRFKLRMQVPMLVVAFPEAGSFEPSAPRDDLVHQLLASGEGPLESLCMTKHLCTRVSVTEGPGTVQRHLLIIAFMLNDAKEAPLAEQAFFEFLSSWRPRAAELRTAQLRLERSRRLGLRSRQDMATTLGRRLLHTGQWKQELEAIDGTVTLHEVHAAISTMTPSNAWVLIPELP